MFFWIAQWRGQGALGVSKIGGVKLSWIKAVFLEDPTRSKLFIFYPWKSEK